MSGFVSLLIWVQVLLLAFPSTEGTQLIDAAGLATLAVLRALGLPTLMPVAVSSGPADLRERAQAKKAVASALNAEVGTS